MSNISTFLSSFKNTELSRPCNFEVFIPPPAAPMLLPYYSKVASNLPLRCETTELPGRTFAIFDQKTYGPVEAFPVQNAYDRINLVFMCSDTMEEKEFFDKWMEYISLSATTFANLPLFGTNRLNFDFEYKDKYCVDIIITQKTLTNTDAYAVKLHRAFPLAVNPINLNWADTNSYNKIVVTFVYTYCVPNSFQSILF